MGMVTVPSCVKYGVRFCEVHNDPEKMAYSALGTYELFGIEAIVVPFDMCFEAEVFGAQMNFYTDTEDILYATVLDKWIEDPDDFDIPPDWDKKGRVQMVADAITMLKELVGDKVAVGTWNLGPFTAAGQAMDINKLLIMSFKEPEKCEEILDKFTDLIMLMARKWRMAGADFYCLREPGAAADLLNPKVFKKLIQPHLIRILDDQPSPKVLHICGETDPIIGFMNECCADAISVEQKATPERQRPILGDDILWFGQFFAWGTLCNDPPEKIEEEIKAEIDYGFNAIWPSCDLWPDVWPQSMQKLTEVVWFYGKEKGYNFPKPRLCLDRQDELQKIREEHGDWFAKRQDRLDKYEFPWDLSKIKVFENRKKPEELFSKGYDVKNSKMIYK